MNEPLWLFRSRYIFENCLLERIQSHASDEPDQDLKLLASLILKIENNSIKWSEFEHKDKLIEMAEASSHWLSILVTLLLRSDEEADRKPALLLLKNCAYSGPLNNKKTNIKLSKDGATRLIRLVFINFQHVKLIAEDMNGLDLSGLDLFGLKASMSNLSKIRFRWTCLNEANFERSKLDQVDFCGSSLCKASFKNSILDMCDISKVDFEEVDLSHVSFKKILLENVMNLEPEQMYSASSFQECSFSECLFRWTKDMIEFIERNGIKRLSSNIARVKVVSTPDQWYKDFIQKENVKIDRGLLFSFYNFKLIKLKFVDLIIAKRFKKLAK